MDFRVKWTNGTTLFLKKLSTLAETEKKGSVRFIAKISLHILFAAYVSTHS